MSLAHTVVFNKEDIKRTVCFERGIWFYGFRREHSREG